MSITGIILYPVDFGNTIKQLRKKAGLTQLELAERIGTSQAAIAQYEKGLKAPELSKLPSIAKAFSVTVSELFTEEQKRIQVTKIKDIPNRRTIKLQKVFEKLKPVEQQFVLKQIEGLIGTK